MRGSTGVKHGLFAKIVVSGSTNMPFFVLLATAF